MNRLNRDADMCGVMQRGLLKREIFFFVYKKKAKKTRKQSIAHILTANGMAWHTQML